MATDKRNRINCLKCKHYTVTWNPKFPNACRLLGFKSTAMPSAVAYESTGKMCACFEPKDAYKAGGGNANRGVHMDEQSVVVSIGNKEERR